MKRSFLMSALLCATLFSTAALAGNDDRRHNGGEREHRNEHRDKRHHRDERHHRNERRHHDKRAHHRNERHHRHARKHHDAHRHHRHAHKYRRHHPSYDRVYKHRRDRHYDDGAFVSGLILGSLASGNDHSYHYSHGKGLHRGHRISYWRDRYGDCYRVEHRKRGKHYVAVPSYKCY